MEKILNIYQRINAVMKEVTYIQKEDKKVNGQYTFASHDAVTARLHGPMTTHGIVMSSSIVELVQDGNRTSVKLEINFINIDEPTDRLTVVYYGYGIDPQDKGIGKAISYAIKYALLKTFCLETGDDVERSNIDYQPEKKPMDAEIVKKALHERKKELMQAVGEENVEFLKAFVVDLKAIYKNKKEEDILLSTSVENLFESFNRWKTKKQAA